MAYAIFRFDAEAGKQIGEQVVGPLLVMQSPVLLPGGEELMLSISAGAHRYAGEDDLRELLAKADAAMYEAEREGRAWVLSE